MITVQHNIEESPNRHIAMLLPIGDFLNYRLSQAKSGELVKFMDGGIGEVAHVSLIKKNSDEARGLSLAIYGHSLDDIFSVMTQNWRHEAYKHLLLFLVVKRYDTQSAPQQIK